MVTLSHLIEKSAFRRVLLSTGLLLCLCSVLNIAAAQSTSQVTIVGIPPVLPSPYADDIETSFVTGQYQIIFNYTSFSNTPAEFAFRFEVLKRSEEHTSELQSRGHLVCRLLLEKKKE